MVATCPVLSPRPTASQQTVAGVRPLPTVGEALAADRGAVIKTTVYILSCRLRRFSGHYADIRGLGRGVARRPILTPFEGKHRQGGGAAVPAPTALSSPRLAQESRRDSRFSSIEPASTVHRWDAVQIHTFQRRSCGRFGELLVVGALEPTELRKKLSDSLSCSPPPAGIFLAVGRPMASTRSIP